MKLLRPVKYLAYLLLLLSPFTQAVPIEHNGYVYDPDKYPNVFLTPGKQFAVLRLDAELTNAEIIEQGFRLNSDFGLFDLETRIITDLLGLSGFQPSYSGPVPTNPYKMKNLLSIIGGSNHSTIILTPSKNSDSGLQGYPGWLSGSPLSLLYSETIDSSQKVIIKAGYITELYPVDIGPYEVRKEFPLGSVFLVKHINEPPMLMLLLACLTGLLITRKKK